MRTILICILSFVLMLSVYGCFSSRERGEKIDSGIDGADVVIDTGGTGGRSGFDGADVVIDTGGTGGRDTSKEGSGAIDDRHTGVAGGIDTVDDAIMSVAPCAPNCPSLEWVTIPGGTFTMGSAEGIGADTERPQHKVAVQTFRISKTEVTIAQYHVCFAASICSAPLNNDERSNWGWSSVRENHPVNGVDWHQAREFAEWLGGRLPSEAEWEYAARSGGRDVVYPWGNEDATCEFAVIGTDASGDDCGYEMTMEVCSKPLGNTIQGLCDMAGNVWEWVEDDWHNSYSGAPPDGQAWIDTPRSNQRVLRGGSWYSIPDNRRCAYRRKNVPGDRYYLFGFRIVLDV